MILTNQKEHYENIVEMCERNADVREMQEYFDNFFRNTMNSYTRAFEKRIFEIHIAPLRVLSAKQCVRDNLLKLYACAIHRHITEDFDYVLSISGLEGRGKSAMSIVLALELQKLGMSFNMNEDMFFRGDANKEGFLRACESVSGKSKNVIIFDEGKAFFDKRQSMNATRIDVLQEITSQRSKNNVLIINVGDSSEIDVYFRERRFRTVFQIPDRYFFVSLQNRGLIGLGVDRFGLQLFEWQLTRMPRIDYMAQLNAMYNLPTQYGIGRIPELPEDIYKQYRKLKDERNSIVSSMIRQKIIGKFKQKKQENYASLLSFGDSK